MALSHGTIIEIKSLSQKWSREALTSLKASLAKLINPFGSEIDKFSISIIAPAEVTEDKRVTAQAAKEKAKPFPKDIVNGRVGNFIFSDLQERTTFIVVTYIEVLTRSIP